MTDGDQEWDDIPTEPTIEEQEAYEQMGYGGYPTPEEKQNIYTYFKKVIGMIDNTKTGNLKDDELGFVKLPVRTNLEIAHYCEKMGMLGFASYFASEAQITSASSLSRDGFLNKLAVTQKRESSVRQRVSSGQQRDGRGFFGKKKTQEQEVDF